MNQEFTVSNLKLVQDEDGYAVCRKVTTNIWEPIATFKFPVDAVKYFYEFIMEAAYIKQVEAKSENKDF